MMTRTQRFLALTSLATVFACGGSSGKPAANEPEPSAVAADSASTTQGGVIGGTAAVGTVALPEIPQAPAQKPATLTAEISLSNPNQQLTQIGTFADAVQPGIGSFITPQTLMQSVGGMVGSDALSGVDLNKPLHIALLDDERVVLIVGVSDETSLNASLSATNKVIFHNGFAAIGQPEALVTVAPYALSNLVNQPSAAEPTLSIFVPSVLNGPKAAELRNDVLSLGEDAGNLVMAGLGELTIIRTTLDANQHGATIRMVAEVKAGGHLQEFLGKQRASDFSMMAPIGTGPWGMVAAGRIDASSFAPVLNNLAGKQANPLVAQVVTHLLSLNGDMAVAMNLPKKPELVMAMDLGDGGGTAQLLTNLLTMMSKQKDLNMEGMIANVKMGSMKAKGGAVHEIKFKPTTDHLKGLYGKKGVSAFVGVVANRFVASFGPNAKKQAKTLANGKANKKGRGKKLEAAMRLSQSARESFFVAMDALALQGARDAKDVPPVVLGLGFTDTSATLRIELPTDFVKEAAQGSLF